MDERLVASVEKLMARVARLGADLWEIYGETVEIRHAGGVHFAFRKPREAIVTEGRSANRSRVLYAQSSTCGWAVRLKKAGRLVFAAGEDESAILTQLDSAVRAPFLLPESDWTAPAFFDPHHQPVLPDERWKFEPPEIRLKVLSEIGVLPRLFYTERCRERLLFNSLGLRAHDVATYYEVWSHTRPISLQRTFAALLEDLLRNYHRIIFESQPRPWSDARTTTEQTPWLLNPEPAISLLSALLLAADRQGCLPLSVSPEIDLIDDGVLPGGFATETFDGQGEKTRRIVVYEAGRPPWPRALLRPFSSAENTPPVWTHWRRATFRHFPRRHYTNALIPPGDIVLDELLESLPEAIFVTEIHPWVSADGTRILLSAKGKIMRRGEDSGAVIMCSEGGGAVELWNRVTARCHGFTMLGNLGAPPLLLDLTNWR